MKFKLQKSKLKMTDQNLKTDEKKEKNQKVETKENTADLEKRIEELENQVKRTLADYRNLENRVQNERGEWILKANKSLLLNILPVLDTLMLADRHNQGKDQSLNLSVKQFLEILEKEGVTRIGAQGKDFDPNLMEVITTVEGEDGKVIEEIRTGYMLYDKVLRPSQVTVGKKTEVKS